MQLQFLVCVIVVGLPFKGRSKSVYAKGRSSRAPLWWCSVRPLRSVASSLIWPLREVS